MTSFKLFCWTVAILRQAKAALVLVIQLAPNLLAVLQCIPTSYAQPCWNHIPLISKDTLSKMLPHYTTNLPFIPNRSLCTMPDLKKKKKIRPPSVWIQFNPNNLTYIGPQNKYQNTAQTGGKCYTPLPKKKVEYSPTKEGELTWKGKKQGHILKKKCLNYRC